MEVSTQSIEMEKQSIENRPIGTMILDLPNMGFTFAYEPPLLIFEKINFLHLKMFGVPCVPGCLVFLVPCFPGCLVFMGA